MKRRVVVSVVFALLAFVFLLRYQGKITRSVESSRSGPAGYSDPAKAIETTVGKEFVISLASNPTTGYGWRIAGKLDESVIKVVEIRHERSIADPRLVGVGGTDLWTLRGLREGEVLVPFEYVRPWEKGVPPVKKSIFTVMIRRS